MVAKKKDALLYSVDDTPPFYLTIPLAIQQFLTCFGAVFSYPLIVGGAICISTDEVGLGEFINTIIFVCGLSSILQTTFGVRLPIIQGASYSFITPVFVLLSTSKEPCPNFVTTENGTLPFEKGSDQHRDIWQANLNQISGALMVAAAIQILVGFSGLIGLLVRFIGPLTIAPTISLIGLSLFSAASDKADSQWWIAFVTIFFITLFSQYLRNVEVPFCRGMKIRIFSLFPVLMGIILSWILCLILTEAGALTNEMGKWGYEARTDIRTSVIENAAWFRFPYPGQWGVPKVTLSGVIGMFAAIFASMIESVGDYYACARLCGISSPPGSAINRGIGMEGITCLLAGAWGCAGGNTSYSENIGAIGITKVGSRRVVQIAGIIMVVLGCVGKFGALFVMIPEPVVGGLFYCMFGMVTAVGISNLQLVDLNSSRNLFVIGFSIFFGLSVPTWIGNNPIDIGDEIGNQVLNVLCGTHMLVGGVIAFFLDNTIPGTKEERGLITLKTEDDETETDWSPYELPFQSRLDKLKFTRYIPFCHGFVGDEVKKERGETTEQPLDDIKDIEEPAGNNVNGYPGVENAAYNADKQEASF